MSPYPDGDILPQLAGNEKNKSLCSCVESDKTILEIVVITLQWSGETSNSVLMLGFPVRIIF